MTRILSSLYPVYKNFLNSLTIIPYFTIIICYTTVNLIFFLLWKYIQHAVEDLVIVVKLTLTFCALKEWGVNHETAGVCIAEVF